MCDDETWMESLWDLDSFPPIINFLAIPILPPVTCEWLTDRFGGFSGIGQSIALATLRSELNGVYDSVILHPWNKDLSAIVTPCVNLNTFSQFNSNSRS